MTDQIALVFEEPPPRIRKPAGSHPPRTRRARRQLQTYVAPASHREHGTKAKYVMEKCRCGDCRAAVRDYERMRARAARRPDQAWVPYVPAGRARRHCEELMAAGIGVKAIAALSGVSNGAVARLVYGDPRRGAAPSRRVRPETERRILAVTVERPA